MREESKKIEITKEYIKISRELWEELRNDPLFLGFIEELEDIDYCIKVSNKMNSDQEEWVPLSQVLGSLKNNEPPKQKAA